MGKILDLIKTTMKATNLDLTSKDGKLSMGIKHNGRNVDLNLDTKSDTADINFKVYSNNDE